MSAVTEAGVRCPQLVYTSAARVLDGSGFGVLARSAGWPAVLGSDRRRLGPLVSFPRALGRETPPTPQYGLLRRHGGALLFRKESAGTDALGRPGNFVIHLVWDPSGDLTPRELPAMLRVPVAELVSLSPTAELAELVVPTQAARPLDLAERDHVAVASAVDALLGDGGDTLLPAELPSGRPTLDVVFHALPWRLLADVSCRAGGEDLEDTARLRVRFEPAGRWSGRASSRALSVVELARAGRLPDSASSAARLYLEIDAEQWADDDPQSLTAGQVGAVLESGRGAAWLERNAATALALLSSAADLAPRVTRLVRRSEPLRQAVHAAGTTMLEGALLGGGPLPRAVLDVAHVTEVDLTRVLARVQEDGRRLEWMEPETAEFVTAVLAGEPSLHPLRLLPLEQLPDLLSRYRLVEVVLRDLPAADRSVRRIASLAVLAADPRLIVRLAEHLPMEETEELAGEAARRAETTEGLLLLLEASQQIPGLSVLRSVLFQATAELASAVLPERAEQLLIDDGWPPRLLRAIKVTARRRRGVPLRRGRRS